MGFFSCFVTFELFVSVLLFFKREGPWVLFHFLLPFFIIWKCFVTFVYSVYDLGFLPTYTYYFGPVAME